MTSQQQQQSHNSAAASDAGKASNINKSAAVYRYGPCKRNHALGSGGNLLDGCQEFDADSESCKICSACGCHRSFHAKIPEEGREDWDSQVLGLGVPEQQDQRQQQQQEQQQQQQQHQQSPGPVFGSAASPNTANPTNCAVPFFASSVSPDDSRESAEKTGGASPNRRGRKPCRSKQLRAKACQIWSDYVRPWSVAQGVNVRFCENKENCVSEMQKGGHPLCLSRCNQLKWPAYVPFCHPKDMASRELQAFISTYERDWQAHCLRNHGLSSACTLLPRLRKDLDPCKVSTKELRYWLKEHGKAVFCVHPKAANQFVNMGKLATMILRSGGKCKFEAANGWDTFVSGREGMNKPALSAGERRKCIRTIKRLYNRFMMEFIQDTLRDMGLENDGEMAVAEVSDDGANDDEDESGDADVNNNNNTDNNNTDNNNTDNNRQKATLNSSSKQQGLYLRDHDLNSTASPRRCLAPLGLM